MKNEQQKKVLEIIRNKMSSEERKQSHQILKLVWSSWLITLLIKEEGYILCKRRVSWICYLSDMAGD